MVCVMLKDMKNFIFKCFKCVHTTWITFNKN